VRRLRGRRLPRHVDGRDRGGRGRDEAGAVPALPVEARALRRAARRLERIRRATSAARSGRGRVEAGFAAYFRFVTDNASGFRLLFGASVRNDPAFSLVAQRTIDEIADMIAALIDIDVTQEHRMVLAHALVGLAEATSRRLQHAGAEKDPEVLARWLAELAWFGLRGVRTGVEGTDDDIASALPG
jgi:hypothetical protein